MTVESSSRAELFGTLIAVDFTGVVFTGCLSPLAFIRLCDFRFSVGQCVSGSTKKNLVLISRSSNNKAHLANFEGLSKDLSHPSYPHP